MPDVPAHQFPYELDRHPLLAWMGEDGVDCVVQELWAELGWQIPGTELLRIGCTGEPDLATRPRVSGVTDSARLYAEAMRLASQP